MSAADPITVVVEFKVQEGQGRRFLALLLEHMPHCVAEPELLRLWVYEDPDDPTRFCLYEDWASAAGFDASLGRDWRGPYMAATEHLWDEPRRTRIWRRVDTPWEPLGPDGQPRSLGTAAPQSAA